jgi:ATP synthase protein I
LSASTLLTEAPLARRVLVLQAILTFVATLLAMPFGSSSSLSVLVGGVGCLVGSAAVVLLMFRDYRAQAPGALVGRLYGAEVVKIALLMAFFAAAFAFIAELQLPIVLGTYLAVQVLPPIFAAQRAHHSPRSSKAPDQVR